MALGLSCIWLAEGGITLIAINTVVCHWFASDAPGQIEAALTAPLWPGLQYWRPALGGSRCTLNQPVTAVHMGSEQPHCCYRIDLMGFSLSPCSTLLCLPLMPFVRSLIFKGENKCEMPQQHSNGSVFSDQYFHPPIAVREEKKKKKKTTDLSLLSFLWKCFSEPTSDMAVDIRLLASPLCFSF